MLDAVIWFEVWHTATWPVTGKAAMFTAEHWACTLVPAKAESTSKAQRYWGLIRRTRVVWVPTHARKGTHSGDQLQ